jgi:uncharacterized protein
LSNRNQPQSPIEEDIEGVLLNVLAFPKSRRNEIAGVRGGRFLTRVTAAPEDGKANFAIVKLLADTLGIAASGITLIYGPTAREKSFYIKGLDAQQVREALNL